MQITQQKEGLKNKRGHMLSISRGQRDDNKGKRAIIKAPQPYELNLSDTEEEFVDLKSQD